jgi:4-hydroxyacetophenone monooxygenase
MSETNIVAAQPGRLADREAQIRRSLATANTNALRLALYQATRDPELAAMQPVHVPVRGGAQRQFVVADDDLPVLIEKAVAYLLDTPAEPGPEPTKDEARELIALFTGGAELSENYLRFALEELALDEFPRDVRWTKPPPQDVFDATHVLIIGAGISGVAAAVQLERLGLRYTVLERQADVGGTWQLNRYPEARVDTSSYMYQFKFEKNYPWTEYFASRDETRRYIRHIAEKYGIIKNLRFEREVVAAKWDEDDAVWTVTTRRADGSEDQLRANFIITGSGLFATPNLEPDIPGIGDFRGRIFHTAQWDRDYDIDGKRIALIGTGSTGVQLMPALAEAAKQLTVYQRTPNWIAGVPGYRDKVPEDARWLFDNLPYYWNWYCYSSFDTSIQLQNAQTYDHEYRARTGGVSEINDKVRQALTDYRRAQLGDRDDLFEKTAPNHAPLGRRLVVDNGFYRALLRPNVTLVTDSIQGVTETGIVSADGEERPFDLIVLAAGFKVTKYLFPVKYEGRDGSTLETAWAKDGARSYLGMTMPGFPNLLMMYGPNGQPRSGGFYSWAEVWARYSAAVIVKVLESGCRSAEVKREVFDDYNRRLDDADAEILWREEADGGYFNNEFGRQAVNIPFRTEDYHAMVADPDLADFDLR